MFYRNIFAIANLANLHRQPYSKNQGFNDICSQIWGRLDFIF